jgi:hypothetical protein
MSIEELHNAVRFLIQMSKELCWRTLTYRRHDAIPDNVDNIIDLKKQLAELKVVLAKIEQKKFVATKATTEGLIYHQMTDFISTMYATICIEVDELAKQITLDP